MKILSTLHGIGHFVNKSAKYYIEHPLILLRNRLIILQLWANKFTKQDVNFNDLVSSEVTIDVVIPAIDKDYDVLIYVIKSIKKNIRHPIGNIFVVSPESKLISGLCEDEGCIFIDENTVLPITKKDIVYSVEGMDRSGWIFQQLLKYGAAKFVKNEYFLIADADTIFCRPQVFVVKDKVLFSVNSQLSHIPYLKLYKKLFGEEATPLINFTSHHILVKKSVLSDLEKELEERFSTSWYMAILDNIDKSEGASSSDYDTYGNFFISKNKDSYLLEHWFNLSLSKKRLKELQFLVEKYKSAYKTISFHAYN